MVRLVMEMRVWGSGMKRSFLGIPTKRRKISSLCTKVDELSRSSCVEGLSGKTLALLGAPPQEPWEDPGTFACPAGDRRELDGLGRRKIEGIEVLSLVAGGVLLRPIEPVPLERRAVEEGVRAVDSRPIPDVLYEVVLDSLAQDVTEALHLRLLLLGD